MVVFTEISLIPLFYSIHWANPYLQTTVYFQTCTHINYIHLLWMLHWHQLHHLMYRWHLFISYIFFTIICSRLIARTLSWKMPFISKYVHCKTLKISYLSCHMSRKQLPPTIKVKGVLCEQETVTIQKGERNTIIVGLSCE